MPIGKSTIEDLGKLQEEITAYRDSAATVLLGAQNLISFNPGEPSNAALQQTITLYSRVVAAADTALGCLAALFALIEIGYPALPKVTVSAAAFSDLDGDMDTNLAAMAVMQVLGASAVTSTVSTEEPIPKDTL